jgi:hypothetical protein
MTVWIAVDGPTTNETIPVIVRNVAAIEEYVTRGRAGYRVSAVGRIAARWLGTDTKVRIYASTIGFSSGEAGLPEVFTDLDRREDDRAQGVSERAGGVDRAREGSVT